jgi:hypothetical protein
MQYRTPSSDDSNLIRRIIRPLCAAHLFAGGHASSVTATIACLRSDGQTVVQPRRAMDVLRRRSVSDARVEFVLT